MGVKWLHLFLPTTLKKYYDDGSILLTIYLLLFLGHHFLPNAGRNNSTQEYYVFGIIMGVSGVALFIPLREMLQHLNY